MNKRIVFSNMEHSDVMRAYADEKLEKIVNFLKNDQGPVDITLSFEPGRVHDDHRVELHVKSARYDLYSAYEQEGMPIYDVLDNAINAMYEKLVHAKANHID